MLGVPLVFAFLSLPATAQTDIGEKVYQQTLRGTVWIVAPIAERNASSEVRVASGTGSLIDKVHRLVITNYHVVSEAKEVRVLFPTYGTDRKLIAERNAYKSLLATQNAIAGEVVIRDPQHDLAVIKLQSVPARARQIPLARESVSPGQRVHSVGNPGVSGALWVYTSGTVRQVYKKRWSVRDARRSLSFEANVVETQSPTNPGDSGGPLVNDRGELVGVTEGYATGAQLVSLFVDVSEVRALLKRHHMLSGVHELAGRASGEKPEEKTESVKDEDPQQKQEQRAANKLQFVKILVKDGRIEKAKERCEEIIATFPMTKSASEAKLLLDQLKQ
jgi:S1-C subfamily serine protease